MRWHVHGTDALTGQDMVLAFNTQDATQAVQAALRKRILVSHVTRANSKRLLFPLTAAISVLFVPLVIALYLQNISIRERLARTVAEQTRLAETVAEAGNIVLQYRQSSPAQILTVQEAADKVRALSQELNTSQARLNLSQQQLTAARSQVEALQHDIANVPGLKNDLAETSRALAQSESQVVRLAAESALRQRRIDELTRLASAPPPPPPPPPPDPAIARARELEAANKELSSQVDLLKSQLLIAAAHSTPASATSPASDPDADPAGPAASPGGSRWALRTGFDAARDMLTLQFDRETLSTTATPDGNVATVASRPANAATLRIVHDRQREKIYSATLNLALAPDTPRDRLAENLNLASAFLKTFAPSLRNAESVLARASADLSLRDPSERQVLLGDDFKLTLWNTRAGTIALKVESPRADLDQ